MVIAVEASSLSAISEIAANPPPHPKWPTGSNGQPLVLYIARVPGSRDVFLTPMKPKEKVVSAEDVQSSLYYIHINHETDSQLFDESRRPSSANTDASQLLRGTEDVVKPKPLAPQRRPVPPATPPYPMESHMPDVPRRSPSPTKGQQIPRKPVLSDITNASMPHMPSLDLPDIPRRPLPTPPIDEPAQHRDSLHADNVRLLRRSDHSDDNNPYLRAYEPSARHSSVDSAASSSPVSLDAGSLILIRRDPHTSAQWNVASIHDPPVHEVSSAALLNPSAGRRVKKSGAPLFLDIVNPGYAQYIDQARPQSRTSTSTASSDSEPPPEGTFRRRLFMPGSKYADHSYARPGLGSASSAGSLEIPRTMRNRSSVDLSSSSLAPPVMDRRSKGYSFTSPWNGQCEFSTSTSGKALKCRHLLPNRNGTLEVSELRFNLPTSSRKTPTPNSEKRGSYFSGMHKRMHSDESWDGGETPSFHTDEDGNMDLSLGQERAGGGFGGKQAKLGKLIIYEGGLAMLDLLVAANIGLWWRAWERV